MFFKAGSGWVDVWSAHSQKGLGKLEVELEDTEQRGHGELVFCYTFFKATAMKI